MAREQVKRKAGAQAAEIGAGVLVRAGAIVSDDPWTIIDDGDPVPDAADAVVSVSRLAAEWPHLSARNLGRVGVIVAPDDRIEDAAAAVKFLSLAMVLFPTFRDGRGYTTARLLRERFAFEQELRAVGDVLEDQLFFMMRCGFDSFDLRATDPLGAVARAETRFRHVYQGSSDGRPSVRDLRRMRTKKDTAA